MERLILCGGGHVSRALAPIGAMLDFAVTVIDDRADFANKERFPTAAGVLALPFKQALSQLGSEADDYFAVLTRGHSFDAQCVEQILLGEFAYLGMIGSRGKVAAVLDGLRVRGFTSGQLAAIHAPIGLNIGGQTPAEIAVSIAAQLVQQRARRGPTPPPPSTERGVLCTIVAKTGSAPRGPGAWMLVRPDGSATGTIGGGAVEFQAIGDAVALWRNGGQPLVKHYDLSGGAAASLGMVCGGAVDVELKIQGA